MGVNREWMHASRQLATDVVRQSTSTRENPRNR